MTIELNKPEKSEYWSIVDSGGNILDSGRLTPDLVLTTNNPTIVHDANQNQYLSAINAVGAAGLPLPEAGTELTADTIYVWNAQNVIVRKDHTRTIYDPDLTPDLFLFYQVDGDDLEWIPQEGVLQGDERIWLDIKYVTNLNHTTIEGQTPDIMPAFWAVVQVGEWPIWIQPDGAGGPNFPYNTGDKVTHVEKHWTSDIDNNVWVPGEYGWTEVV